MAEEDEEAVLALARLSMQGTPLPLGELADEDPAILELAAAEATTPGLLKQVLGADPEALRMSALMETLSDDERSELILLLEYEATSTPESPSPQAGPAASASEIAKRILSKMATHNVRRAKLLEQLAAHDGKKVLHPHEDLVYTLKSCDSTREPKYQSHGGTWAISRRLRDARRRPSALAARRRRDEQQQRAQGMAQPHG